MLLFPRHLNAYHRRDDLNLFGGLLRMDRLHYLLRLLLNLLLQSKVIQLWSVAFNLFEILRDLWLIYVVYLLLLSWLLTGLKRWLMRLSYLHGFLTLDVESAIILSFCMGSLIIILKSGVLHLKLLLAIYLRREINVALRNLIQQRGLLWRLILWDILVRRLLEVLLNLQISLFFLVLKLLVHWS